MAQEGCASIRKGEANSVKTYDGVLETLASLRELHQQIAIFTGASSRAARTLLASAGIEFYILVGRDHVRRPKPVPDGVL